MNTELATKDSAEIAVARPQFDLSPQTFEQALTFANYLADSDMVPKDFKGKPGNCLIAMQWGNELGMKAIQAIQNIAVINGRPALWGDALIALVRSSPVCEYIIETQTDAVATCRVKRRGEPEQERSFSTSDAKSAGLLGKQGPWTQYPKRMLQLRARAFALRDVFPDVLRGLPIAEEVMDTPRDMGAAEVVTETAPPELVSKADEAAKKGVAAYQAFWKATSNDDRRKLIDGHDKRKAEAVASDAARTVQDTPDKPVERPVVTFAAVMDKLVKAKTLDALDVACDWVGEVADPEQRAELTAKYDELRMKLAGAV